MPKQDRFTQLIANPLESSDRISFNRIKKLLESQNADSKHPFSYIIKKLTGKSYSEELAVEHWHHILDNKTNMETKLGRTVSIQTAAVDYFSEKAAPKEPSEKHDADKAAGQKDTIADMGVSADYHQTLQDEISRARRYNHALSALLLEVDEFHRINEELSRKTGDEILSVVVKIITKSIRTVDKLARFSGDQFLIILPNTNQREAFELAERIRQNIYKRTARMHNLPRGITVTLSVRQYGGDEKASGLISDLERILRIGKQRGRDSVYAREDITASTIG